MTEIQQSNRLPIPPEHTYITINGCEYIKFVLNGAKLLECRNCGMRSLYNLGYYRIYHKRICEHWINHTTSTTHIINRYIYLLHQFTLLIVIFKFLF